MSRSPFASVSARLWRLTSAVARLRLAVRPVQQSSPIRARQVPSRGGRRLPLLLAVALAATFASTAGGTRGGALDRSFDGDGKLIDARTSYTQTHDVAVQRDGRILLVGDSSDPARRQAEIEFALSRYRADGVLDETFSGGRVFTVLDRWASAYAVALQPDGKIVAAGNAAGMGRGNFGLARYGNDGSLDASFGERGTVRTDFGGQPFGLDLVYESAADVLVQPDGRIIAAGRAVQYGASGRAEDFALARYNADGSLDPSFDGDGRVITAFGAGTGMANVRGGTAAVARQSDGKILAAGSALNEQAESRIALARYLPDGRLDASFDSDGRAITDIPNTQEQATAIGVQADGRIVIAVAGTGDLTLARYLASGSLDPSFGEAGLVRVRSAASEVASDLAIQRNGKILVFGYSVRESNRGSDFALARVLPTGVLDPNFGSNGAVVTDLGSPAGGLAVALQADGKIVGAGTAPVEEAGGRVALARYLAGTCSVPRLKGATLAAARSRLASANCRLGRVRRVLATRVRRSRVVSQAPPAGRETADWAYVNLVVSRGRRAARERQ
jgi:uncharacterized delta-60 repeat protein